MKIGELSWEQEYWIQQVGHGHVDDKEIDWFSQGLRFVNNYCYKGIPKQRNDEYQAVSNGFSNFCCCRIKRTGAAGSIHRCVHIFWFSCFFHKLIWFLRTKPPLLYLCLRGNYHLVYDSSPAQGKKGAFEFTDANH